MKYSIFNLGLLLSFAASAMEEIGTRALCKPCAVKEKKEEKLIKTRVGQTVVLPLFTKDQHALVFYTLEKKPDETILQFMGDEEQKISAYSTNVSAKYLALKQGTTDLRFWLKAQAMCKSLGFVSYTVVVE